MRYFTFILFAISLSACAATKAVFAMMKSTDEFHSLSSDNRIKYESGAPLDARIVSADLNRAIHKIETRQYGKFVKSVIIYLPGTIKSFASFCASEKAGGCVMNSRLFLSPKKQNTPNRIPKVLAHELSHLQMQQILGMWKWHENAPAWFREGLAVYASDGGGAEGVSPIQAKQAIISGHSFIPNDSGRLLFPKTAHAYRLKPHMFYKQAGLFVSWLHQSDNEKFKKLILALQAGVPFKEAMQKSYGSSARQNWEKFVWELKKPRHA